MPDTPSGVMRAHQGMLIWALIVGMSFPAVGMMSEGLPPLSLTAIRFVIAALAESTWPGAVRDHGAESRGFLWHNVLGLASHQRVVDGYALRQRAIVGLLPRSTTWR